MRGLAFRKRLLEWYVERRLQSVGFIWDKSGGAWQGHFLADSRLRSSILQTLIEKNKIEKMKIEGIEEPFYLSKDSFEHMKPRTTDSYVRFLAPLDNLMWDRQMLEALFDFNYRWEVYTPVAKRKFGYYVLPVLYNGQFIARLLHYVSENTHVGGRSSIQLIAEPGKEPFYESLGFKKILYKYCRCGMRKIIRRK